MNASSTPTTDVRAEIDGAVITLTLDGPQTRNSISPPVYRAIQDHIISAGQDPAIRAIVLNGDHGFFSSGGNINNLQASALSTMAEVSRNTDALNSMILAIRECPTPVVAAVEGGAAGAGLSLVLACDMIVAAEPAKFVVAYVKVGLAPDGGITHFLREGLPRQIVSEMCLTGDPVTAERLHMLGIVNSVVPAGEVITKAQDVASRLARGAAGAQGVIKAEIAAAPHNDLATQLVLEARGINTARFGAEAAEGLAAFVEKRKPAFAAKGAS